MKKPDLISAASGFNIHNEMASLSYLDQHSYSACFSNNVRNHCLFTSRFARNTRRHYCSTVERQHFNNLTPPSSSYILQNAAVLISRETSPEMSFFLPAAATERNHLVLLTQYHCVRFTTGLTNNHSHGGQGPVWPAEANKAN